MEAVVEAALLRLVAADHDEAELAAVSPGADVLDAGGSGAGWLRWLLIRGPPAGGVGDLRVHSLVLL